MNPNKNDLRPDQVVLDLVLSYCTTMPKFGFAAVLGGGDLAGTVPSLIIASKNHLGQPTMTGVPIYFDGDPFDGDPVETKPPRFVMRKIGSTVWKVAPSIATPLLHAFVTHRRPPRRREVGEEMLTQDNAKAIEKTKKPIHPKAMPISAAKRKRESKLLMELQKNHGYTMLDTVKSADRFMWSFNFKTGAGTLTRMLRLSVPRESALGRAMAQSDKAKDAKARAEAKVKARKAKAKLESRKTNAMAKVDKLAAKVARKVTP